MSVYYYYVNLDERGQFFADVRDSNGETVFEIDGFEILEDGFMRHKGDLSGLLNHLLSLKIVPEGSTLDKGN